MKYIQKLVVALAALVASAGVLAHDGHGVGVVHDLHHALYIAVPIFALSLVLSYYYTKRNDN